MKSGSPSGEDNRHVAERLEAELIEEELRARRGATPATPFDDVPHPSDGAGDPSDGEFFRRTELGNAQRFARMHGARLRFVYAWDTWLEWDGKRWCHDETGAEDRAAKEVVEHLFELAGEATAKRDAARAEMPPEAAGLARAKLGKVVDAAQLAAMDESSSAAETAAEFARASSKASAISAMTRLARSEHPIVAQQADFDRDIWTINLQNGTLDLRTGELRPHRQADLLTKTASASYDPAARCPRWDAFLERILPDAELRTWIQRFLGYCLTGNVGEQVLMFALGTGNNGKNVLLDTMLGVLGDYAMRAAPDLVLAKHNEDHPTGLADLQGKRMVIVSEIDQGRQWNEALIKRITGDTTIKARKMHKDFYEFPAVHKLLIMANTEPEVRGTDNGIWRRIKLAPFGVTIPEAERDKGLIPKLLEEIDGIFAWCVRGCLDWQRHGLGIVAAVEKATAQYRREQDVIGEWISERCLCVCADQAGGQDGLCETCGAFIDGAPRLVTEKAPYEAMADLYEDFAVWCRSTGRERPWKRLTLRKRLLERPGLSDHRVTAARVIAGIKLRPAPVSTAWKQHQGQRDRFDE